jgi:hypothetical protein
MRPTTSIDNNLDSFTYREKHAHRRDIIERLLIVSESFITGTLAIRFFLALLGANPINGFDHSINSFTTPFANPFYGLFSYDHAQVGEVVFEGYALVAIIVYALIFSGLIKLTQLTRYE